ncbi:metallophosphoesterase family protein [Negadavirga shengliensis]|uniref:Nuclease SbcCD subunit D n=1 Tax=Negadavirga shengliensis TaxID=1389218 RepID=A0ABV9SY44_9BACT
MHIKILHTADWHLGKKLQEFSRIEEQQEVIDEIVQIAEREDVDLVLLAGDIFDTFNPSHEAIELLYKALKRLSNGGKRPIVAISGNHDSTQFVEAPDPLAREMGILFYSRYESVIPSFKADSGLEITKSAPGFLELKLAHIPFPVRIILAPYANELLLKTYLGVEDREAEIANILGSQWEKIAREHFDANGVNLFLGHFFFVKKGETPPPEPESEKSILHVGGTQAIPTDKIPPATQYAALGHLHRYQTMNNSTTPVVYSSSPLAYSFSEAEQEKRVVLIKAKPASAVTYEPINLVKGKPLYRKRFNNLSDTLKWLEDNPYCFVELTYASDEAIDAASRKAIMKAHGGIVALIPEIKSEMNRETGGLLADDLSQDMVTLFSKYYQTQKGQMPNQELLQLFREIISQDQEA